MKKFNLNKYIQKNIKDVHKKEESKDGGWGPLSAILVTLGIYFGAQLIAGYLIVQYLILSGKNKDAISSTIDGSVILQFSFIFIAEIMSLILLWWFLRRRKIPLSRIGLKKPTKNNLLYAIPAYGVYFTVLLVAFSFLQRFVHEINFDQSQDIGFATASSAGPLLFVFVALVILPALTEEIMVRGFLYGGLRNKLPFVNSAILTSIIFGLAHLQLGSGNSPVWTAAIDTFMLSLILVWLREKTGNIWAGVLVHMAKNSLAFISLFILKIT